MLPEAYMTTIAYVCVSSFTFEDSYQVSNSQFLASVDMSVLAGQFEMR